ncbi:MAG: hypothetical protein HZC37_22200 [Burkholderiales bacterium]|nr:hypothetical protein [Burkholderiales bacterium]
MDELPDALRHAPAWAVTVALAAGGVVFAAPPAPPASASAASNAAPVRVPAEWFSCDGGKYALQLPHHYPTLPKIGKHKVVDLEVRQVDGATVTTRRFQYIGMRLDVRVLSSDPDRYALLAAEVTSRRWQIGRFSVGTRPWPWMWSPEPSLKDVKLHGLLELVGAGDSALLWLNDGRVERVSYRCRAAAPRA